MTKTAIKSTPSMPTVPELLAPAGNLEKLKVAVLYGANAVYLGGQKFGLRAASDNFTLPELAEGVAFAHERGALVYVVLNSFLHDKDLQELPDFVRFLQEVGVDAVIVSDLGVVETVRAHSQIPVHLSTQASCLNAESAKLWAQMGVTRVVLGREVSVAEAGQIKRASGLEVEMFIHGSMCMAYSGHCVISNYTQGRDSNRGGCAQSCRFEYSLDFHQHEKEGVKSHFMSSKDLEGLLALPEFVKEGIDSIKVEGRMKGHLYAATISKVYSEALGHYRERGDLQDAPLGLWQAELRKMSHREYTEASLRGPADSSSIYDQREHEEQDWEFTGVVLEASPELGVYLEVRSRFEEGEELELMPFHGPSIPFTVSDIRRLHGESVPFTHPGSVVILPYVEGAERFNMARRKIRRA